MATASRNRKSSAPETYSPYDLPVLSDEERAQLLQSLVEADARIAAGDFVVLDSATFRAWFEEMGRKAGRARET